jgi:hypothetical protein
MSHMTGKSGGGLGQPFWTAIPLWYAVLHIDLPYCNMGAITSMQCDKINIHMDQCACFGLWPLGVFPTQLEPNCSVHSTAVSPFTIPVSITPQKQQERCAITDCRGFTAMGYPYHHWMQQTQSLGHSP